MDRDERINKLVEIISLGVHGYYEESLHPKILDPIPLKKYNFPAAISAIKLLNEMTGNTQEAVNVTVTIVEPNYDLSQTTGDSNYQSEE